LADSNAAMARLLGDRGAAVLAQIPDSDARARAAAGLEAVAEALEVVRRVDLSPHELADGGTWDLSAWNALAPDVRTLLLSVRRAIERVRELYPAPPDADRAELGSIDLDLAFDDPDCSPDRGPQVDAALAEDTDPIPVIASLTAMLEADLRSFGQRMRSPQLMAERWALLGELHELQGNCVQCLDAVAAAILRPWTDQPVESWLPDYASAVTRVVRLRGRVVELQHEAAELQRIWESDPAQKGRVFRRLDEMLREFAADPAHGDLRPLDKQQVLQFRGWLMRAAPDWEDGTHRLEDFVRFLEVMRDINRREVLRDHDHERLGIAIMLLESDEPVDAVRAELEAVYGRSNELDELLRGWRERETPSAEAVLDAARRARDALG